MWRNSRKLVLLQDAKESGRVLADVRFKQNVEVPASGLSGITASGSKCDHGVYIPATSPWTDHAPDCSICRPYVIEVKDGGVYKA